MISRIRGISVPYYRASVMLKLSTFRVTSAIVQRYLTPILDAALSQNLQIQATAIDVLSFTIKQGLAHPLQVYSIPSCQVVTYFCT